MNSKLILVVLVSIICIFSVLSLYYGVYLVEVEDFPMDFHVGTRIGMNADTDALHFGTTLKGSKSSRKLFVHNNNDFPVVFAIYVDGNFSDWVELNQNMFELAPATNTSVSFVVTAPEDADYGRYEGIATVKVRRSIW